MTAMGCLRPEWVESGHCGFQRFLSSRSCQSALTGVCRARLAKRSQPIESKPIDRAIGCTSVVPAAFIGLAGLADYVGPKGWHGASEFVGWIAICVAVGLGVGLLLAQWRQRGWRRYAAVPLALGAIAGFTYAPHWLGLHVPMSAKVAFTTSLQVVGSLATTGVALWLSYIVWHERRRS